LFLARRFGANQRESVNLTGGLTYFEESAWVQMEYLVV